MTKLIIKTPDELDKPDWWTNFVESLPQGSDTTADYWYEKRDQHLARYGAVLTYRAGQAEIEFESESALTMFLMRFS